MYCYCYCGVFMRSVFSLKLASQRAVYSVCQVIFAFLPEYLSESLFASVCVFVCFRVCFCMITQKERDLGM